MSASIPLRIATFLAPTALLALSLAGPVAAQVTRLVEADERGVTLRVTVPAFSVSAPGEDGRVRIDAPGMSVARTPGRPHVPFAAATIALPPGARAVARVLGGDPEAARDGIRLSIAGRPGFREDAALGIIPTEEIVEPLRDGIWPRSAAEVEAPYNLRRQRVAIVRIYPFRYDEAANRLMSRQTMNVRVDFIGGEARGVGPVVDDRYWEPVLESTLLNYQQGRRWRIAPQRATRVGASLFGLEPGETPHGLQGAAFDEDEAEVRVRIDTSGVYALPYDQLETHGFTAAVPISEVSVHRHEFVEDSSPPYVTIELPIEVDDANQDNVFNSGDQILVFVQNWAERSRVTFGQRLWGDAEMVYATHLPGRQGLRMGTRPGWLDQSLTPLASYPYRQRWEENHFYLSGFHPGVSDTNKDLFHWTDLQIYSRPNAFGFAVNHLDTTRSAQLWVNWEGRKNNPHISWATVVNASGQTTTLVDSASWSGHASFTATALVTGSAISEGNTNTLRSWGKTRPSDPPESIVNAGFNWFDVEYWRAYQALNGYLSCNSRGASGDYEIVAHGFFNADIRVYDVTDSLVPLRLTLADSLISDDGPFKQVRFQDSNPSGVTKRYVVFNRAKALPADRFQTVTRRNLAARASGDYLLIVPEAFLDEVEPLRAHRAAQGMNVVVAPLEAVNDEFNGGRHSAHSIRRFIRYAFNNWDARFVLLVGDGSEDPQNHLGNSGKDWVPAPKIGGPVGVNDGTSTILETVPSDPWYVWCLECEDKPRSDRIHDLFIGRLPTNSVQQTRDVVSKVISYEDVSEDDEWRRRMLLLADDLYSTTSFFGGGGSGGPQYCRRSYEGIFLSINESIRSVILDEAMLVESEPEVFNLNYYLRDEPFTVPRPGDTCRVDWNATQQRAHANVTPEIFERLNRGVLWWNYQGHANQYVMSHEDIYVNRGTNDDKDMFMNEGKLFMFSAFACHPNGFAVASEGASNRGPSFGEEMVGLADVGAVASWGSSGFEILPGSFGEHLNVHYARALFSDPPRDKDSGEANVVLGEAVAVALVNNLAGATFSLERQVGVTYHLLGDPATRLSIGRSQFMVTANGQPVSSGEPVRLFSFGDTLKLEADLVSNVAIKSITLERSDAVATTIVPESEYSLTPAFPDTAATGMGGRKYHLSYQTLLQLGSFRYTIRTLDRNGVPGTFDVVFQFETVLRNEGTPIADGDPVGAEAGLSLLVLSPGQLTQSDFALELNGSAVSFEAIGDTTGREWTITWNHPPYAPGAYRLDLSVAGELSSSHAFRVESQMRFENAMAFPNPFDDELGTRFSFTLTSSRSTNLLIRVFTVSGRLIYERKELDLLPGYHQLAWNGRDAEGQKLANGVYLYRMIARNADESTLYEGRLVKLRKPRRAVPDETNP